MIIGTIKENLLYGNKDATENQINEALKKAQNQRTVEPGDFVVELGSSSTDIRQNGKFKVQNP